MRLKSLIAIQASIFGLFVACSSASPLYIGSNYTNADDGGPSGEAPATVVSSIPNFTFKAASATFTSDPPFAGTGSLVDAGVPDGGGPAEVELVNNGTGPRYVITITDVANACSIADAGVKGGSTVLSVLIVLPIGGALLMPGTYDTNGDAGGGATPATAIINQYDNQCNFTAFSNSPGSIETGGTVTITAATQSEIAGTFNFLFPGGTLNGSFKALPCASPPDQGTGCLK